MINKPMLFTTDDLAEGVYAAGSGSSSETVNYKLDIRSEGNENDKRNEYSITFTNNTGKTLNSFSVRLTSNKNISSVVCYDSYLISGEVVNSTTLELTYTAAGDWAKLESGRSTQPLGFAVYSDVVPFTLN